MNHEVQLDFSVLGWRCFLFFFGNRIIGNIRKKPWTLTITLFTRYFSHCGCRHGVSGMSITWLQTFSTVCFFGVLNFRHRQHNRTKFEHFVISHQTETAISHIADDENEYRVLVWSRCNYHVNRFAHNSFFTLICVRERRGCRAFKQYSIQLKRWNRWNPQTNEKNK